VVDLARTACELSASKTGALMVIERGSNLENMIKGGTVIDAKVTPRLLCNIFYNKAPLHDGAVIIRDFRLHTGLDNVCGACAKCRADCAQHIFRSSMASLRQSQPI
jgi:hypothetical protein